MQWIRKPSPGLFPSLTLETLAANATSKSSMLRQTLKPAPKARLESAQRAGTLIVRARPRQPRRPRHPQSWIPSATAPRRPASSTYKAPSSSDAAASARLRAAPSPKTRGTQYPWGQPVRQIALASGAARIMLHPGIALMPDHGKLPDAGQERRLHRLEIRRAGQRRGQQFLADDAAGAPPVDQQPHRLLANMRDAIAQAMETRVALDLLQHAERLCGPPPRSRPAGSARRHRGLDGWRRPSGRARLFPDADGHAARHIDLARAASRQTRRRIACSCKAPV